MRAGSTTAAARSSVMPPIATSGRPCGACAAGRLARRGRGRPHRSRSPSSRCRRPGRSRRSEIGSRQSPRRAARACASTVRRWRPSPTMRPDLGGRQILLSDVHAGRAGQPRDVGAIVHDDLAPPADARSTIAAGCVEQRRDERLLGADLQQRRAAVQTRRREVDERPAGARADVGVADRVEGSERASASAKARSDSEVAEVKTSALVTCDRVQTASASWPRGRRARNCSMNDVLSWPATKSGSLRIRRCSGIDGLDAFDDRHLERAAHAGDRLRAVAAVHDDLGDHRVVVRRDRALGVRERLDADAGTARHAERVDRCPATARTSPDPRR